MSRRAVTAVVAAGLLGAATLAVSAAAAPAAVPSRLGVVGTAAEPPSRQTQTGPLTFSHETIVDEQRSGFEPGLQVDSTGRIYTSVPNGFSNTQSYLWSSADHGSSFHQVAGQVATGKTSTCVGGGDTELAVDGKDNLFYSDLQGLTNLSNSVTTDQGATFSTSCTSSATTAPVDRMWYAVNGSLGDPDFAIYEEFDAVESSVGSNTGGNELVETYSTDGVNFLPVTNTNFPSADCLGLGAVNCVDTNEGIPGNQVLATAGPNKGDLLIAHTSSDSNQVVVDRGALSTDATTGLTDATWTPTVVNASLCPDPATPAAGTTQVCGASSFATIAEDAAGHFYVVLASQQTTADGSGTNALSGPEEVYVVESDDGTTWGAPVQISTAGGSNAFPWVVAGSDGRLAAAWYTTSEESENGGFAFDDLKSAEFSVQVGTSLDAAAPTPHYAVSTVSEHPIKYGSICTQGLGCTVSGGDRSLGDYLQDHITPDGRLIVTYVDDTSNEYAASTIPGGDNAESGPNVVSTQIGGPSMLASVGTVTGQGAGPGIEQDSVTDPTGDAFLSLNSLVTPATGSLDLLGASLTEAPGSGDLVVVMTLADATSLLASPTLVGTTTDYITRFTTYDPGTPGNGHIYYAGAESVAGTDPTFFDGDTTRPSDSAYKYAEFDSTHAVAGEVNPENGTITLRVPRADIGGEPDGKELYSVTAFTSTTVGTAASPVALLNLIDATPPFNHVLGVKDAATVLPPALPPVTAPGAPTSPTAPTAPPASSGSLASTGLGVGIPVVAVVLVLGGAAVARRRHGPGPQA